MKAYPSKNISFELIDSRQNTLERLQRRTDYSENLTSQVTNKSFRGLIKGNHFEVITSTPGVGAFCKMTGKIEESDGTLKIEIHKAFRVLLGIIYSFPIVALLLPIISTKQEFEPLMVLVTILQILFIRFLFVELLFRFLSQLSLKRLIDVLDIKVK